MRKVVIKSDKEPDKKFKWTIRQKTLLAWTAINLMLSFCLAIYSIVSKWGSSTLGLVWLYLLGFYLLIFSFILVISLKKSAKVLRYRLKYGIIIVKILTNLSNLTNLLMSLSMLIIARLKGDMTGATAILSLLGVFLFTLIAIILNINNLKNNRAKRIKQRAKQNKAAAKKDKAAVRENMTVDEETE